MEVCNIFRVGGSVRDELLKRKTNDYDFTVVVNDNSVKNVLEGYNIMKEYMLFQGYTIFLETPECFTIRGKMPDGMVGDFVLAYKKIGYYENTRIPIVELGTLEDDLKRRDFTINALARNKFGTIIDWFDGRSDLQRQILKTPLEPMITLSDDPLRALRAVRFSIVLDFEFDAALQEALHNSRLPILTKRLVNTDRIRQELSKCFKHNTWATYAKLQSLPNRLVNSWLNRDNLWLKPTTQR